MKKNEAIDYLIGIYKDQLDNARRTIADENESIAHYKELLKEKPDDSYHQSFGKGLISQCECHIDDAYDELDEANAWIAVLKSLKENKA